MQSETILSYNVCSFSLDKFESYLAENWQNLNKTLISCINPHSYITAKSNPDFQQSLRQASILIPDGSGFVLASKLLGGQIRERITGSDLFNATNKLSNATPLKYYFVGSSEMILDQIEAKLKQEFPNISVVGKFSPPFVKSLRFSEETNKEIIDDINACQPDVIWVGLSAPKQEIWILDNLSKINGCKLIAPIGAVFDFYTGNIKRSPKFFRDMHLEWLPRLLQEPRRLFRRNFISSPLFLKDVLFHLISSFFSSSDK